MTLVLMFLGKRGLWTRRTHESAEVGLLHGGLSLEDFLVLHKGICSFDLHPGQPPKSLKVLFQVPLSRVLNIEVNHKEGASRPDVALPGVFPPLDVPVALLEGKPS